MPRSAQEQARRREQLALRSRMIAYGRWQPFTDAGPAREHLRKLADAGIGWRRAAELAGLNPGTMTGILFGQHGRPPSRRIRDATSAAILAVQPSPQMAAAGAKVDATGTQRRVQALVASGRPVSEIARQLGRHPRLFHRILSQPTVTAETAAEVRALYSRIGERMPETEGRHARAARELAAKRGWPPPSAWEPEDLDNPEAGPVEGWQEWQRQPVRGRERWAAVAEDADFVARQEGLATKAQIAERLGLTEGTLTTLLIRAGIADNGRVQDAQCVTPAQECEPAQMEAEAG